MFMRILFSSSLVMCLLCHSYGSQSQSQSSFYASSCSSNIQLRASGDDDGGGAPTGSLRAASSSSSTAASPSASLSSPSSNEREVFEVCTLDGPIEDCNCGYGEADRVNAEHVHALVHDLVQLPFFAYFRAHLHCDCPLWDDDGTCNNRNCGVDTCPAAEVPATHRCHSRPPTFPHDDASTWNDADVDTRWGSDASSSKPNEHLAANVVPFAGWDDEADNPWTWDDEAADDSPGWAYVDLRRNPERFTGYGGEHANKIWRAIYTQPCFAHLNEEESALTDKGNVTCDRASRGRRILYRLISGMHASITAHISREYPMDIERSEDCVWGPNLAHFHATLGQDTVEHSNRLSNLYFTYLFVLRAVTKACSFLKAADYGTGNAVPDARTAELMSSLCDDERLEELTCARPFDEASVFLVRAATDGSATDGDDDVANAQSKLELELMRHFQSISAVMSCVGCEKCRLWGKLQTLGLATALKILFHDVAAISSDRPDSVAFPKLARNEIVALVNLLSKLSTSVHTVREMRRQLMHDFVNGSGAFSLDVVGETKVPGGEFLEAVGGGGGGRGGSLPAWV